MEIRKNLFNHGYGCFFEHEGKQYYADVAVTMDHGNSCMIFPAKNNKVTNWDELYAKTDIPVSEESLRECIKEFIDLLDKH